MAKKRADGSEPPTGAAKIDRGLLSKARILAADRDISLAEYLSEILRPVVERDWAKMIKRVGEEGAK